MENDQLKENINSIRNYVKKFPNTANSSKFREILRFVDENPPTNSEAAKNRIMKAMKAIRSDRIGPETKLSVSEVYKSHPKPINKILVPDQTRYQQNKKSAQFVIDTNGNRKYFRRDASNFDKLIRAACTRIHEGRKEFEYLVPDEKLVLIDEGITKLLELADYLSDRAKGIEK